MKVYEKLKLTSEIVDVTIYYAAFNIIYKFSNTILFSVIYALGCCVCAFLSAFLMFTTGAHMFALAARSVKTGNTAAHNTRNSSSRHLPSNSTPAPKVAKSPYHSRHLHLLQTPSPIQRFPDAVTISGSGYNRFDTGFQIPIVDNIPIIQESNQISDYRTTGKVYKILTCHLTSKQ